MASYHEAHRKGRRLTDNALLKGGIITGYLQSPEFEGLTHRTKRDYRQQIFKIERDFGDLPIEAMDEDHQGVSGLARWHGIKPQTGGITPSPYFCSCCHGQGVEALPPIVLHIESNASTIQWQPLRESLERSTDRGVHGRRTLNITMGDGVSRGDSATTRRPALAAMDRMTSQPTSDAQQGWIRTPTVQDRTACENPCDETTRWSPQGDAAPWSDHGKATRSQSVVRRRQEGWDRKEHRQDKWR